MTKNNHDHWTNQQWPYLVVLCSISVLLVTIGVDWAEALKWWGEAAAPHESLRNLGLMLAGFFGIGLATWRSTVASAQAKTAQQGHITDRFSKAVEQLGTENVTVRIGGIYALKRIAQDSRDRDHISVMEVLTNFIRHSPYAKQQREAKDKDDNLDRYFALCKEDEKYAEKHPTPEHGHIIDCPDIIAAIDTIQTRTADQKIFETSHNYIPTLKNANFSYFNLDDVDLSGFDLNGVNLQKANINGVNLSNVDLSGYDLKNADFSCAILLNIDLSKSELVGSSFLGADLTGAILTRALLHNADFTEANLTRANLKDANLQNATLTDADLTDADLTGANLTDSSITGVNFSNTNLFGAGLKGTNPYKYKVSYDDFLAVNPENVNVTREEFYELMNAPDMSESFTRPGQPPRNLRNEIMAPPEKG